MALYKLEDGTSSVDMSPQRGLNIPETRIREHIEAKEGHADTHEWGNAEKYEIPLINITKARANQLLDWWLNMEVLTFTPDPGDPIQMVIDGIERPLNMWHHLFDDKYAGMLRLCEVSSQSFSSSHVSVSKSESCSSFDSSPSCADFSSLSCSTFLTFVSHSSSLGVDADDSVLVQNVSCSTYRSCSDSESYSNSTSYSTFRSCSESESYSVSRSCSEDLSTQLFSSFISGGYSHLSSVLTLSSCEDLSSRSASSSCDDVSDGIETSSRIATSSCEDLSSCSDSYSISRSSSIGVIAVSFTSQSCSLNSASTSCSVSEAGTSCSLSAGGIS